MHRDRLKSVLLAGGLSTMAAAIAVTVPAPRPVSAAENAIHVAQAMTNPCGPTSPCAPASSSKGAVSPCSPCAPASHSGGQKSMPAAPCAPASPCAPSKS